MSEPASRRARVLMLQGTSSSVGKSLLVAALCRILRQDGLAVAPFKAQNMALNAGVTSDGLEMGRAQIVQAEAAGVEPTVDMNPVLLKPEGTMRSQVVLRGRPAGHLSGRDYLTKRTELWGTVTQSLDRLRASYDVVVIEGAGSPAEINLREGDIVNMRVAAYAEAPVLLVGDIDRGGVFAALVGTLALLEADEVDRIKGFLINKFRGHRDLLEPGLRMLEARTGVPVLGVVPYLEDLRIAEEDSVSIERQSVRNRPALAERRERNVAGPLAEPTPPERGLLADTLAPIQPPTPQSPPLNSQLPTPDTQHPGAKHPYPEPLPEGAATYIDIAVVRLPHIANFDDFDLLAAESGVGLRFVFEARELGDPDLLILPGCKATIADLAWLRDRGLADAIGRLVQRGGPVLGVCGGYQMLGITIEDAEGIEGVPGTFEGLGLLPVRTVLTPEKRTVRVQIDVAASVGPFAAAHGAAGRGYEIHVGRTYRDLMAARSANRPVGEDLLRISAPGQPSHLDGHQTTDGLVAGTYVHGLFENAILRRSLVEWLAERSGTSAGPAVDLSRDAEYDRLAAAVRASIDLDHIFRVIDLTR